MAKLLLNRVVLTAALGLFVFYLSAGIAAAGTIEVYVSFGITDNEGVELRGDGGPDSDLVQVIYAGPDGVPNPPGGYGTATDDDVILELEGMPGQHYTRIGSGFPFDPDEGKFHGDFRHDLPAGAKIFIRAWNAPTVADSTRYGNSSLYPIRGVVGESHDFAPFSTILEPPPGVGKDGTPPGNVTNFKAVAGDRQVTLTWTNPVDIDFAGTFIVRCTSDYPTTIADGEIVRTPPGIPGDTQSWTNVVLSNETTYFYAAFAHDTSLPPRRNFASGTRVSAIPLALAAPAPGNGCFIATAAYGTPLAEEIIVLSRFRDEHLLTNRWGKAIVKAYYEHSPQWAGYIEKRPVLRAIVRHSLRPLIWSLRFLSSRRINDDDQESILSR